MACMHLQMGQGSLLQFLNLYSRKKIVLSKPYVPIWKECQVKYNSSTLKEHRYREVGTEKTEASGTPLEGLPKLCGTQPPSRSSLSRSDLSMKGPRWPRLPHCSSSDPQQCKDPPPPGRWGALFSLHIELYLASCGTKYSTSPPYTFPSLFPKSHFCLVLDLL